MVIAGHPRLVQPVELLLVEKAHGGAQVDLARPVHGLIGLDGLVELRPGEGPPGGDDGEAVHALLLVELAHPQNLLLGQEVIDFAVGVVVGGLGAVFAVLRAAAAAAVDDGTQVHLVPHAVGPDLVGPLAQLV